MKFKLPIIGEISIGEPNVIKEIVREIKEAEKTVGGGFLDFNYGNSLSDEKRVSSKVLEANKGWVYRNTDVIASEVAGIEFELFTIKLVGNEIVYNPILRHPILDALDRFNDFTDASSGFYTTEAHRLLAGDSFWYISGKGPNVQGIYLLQPDKVEIKFGDVSEGQRVIIAYQFTDTVNGKPIDKTYDAEEIIHHKVPNPKNPYRGLGKVEVAADAIDTDTFAMEANKQLFRRGLISNFVLTTPNKLTDEQLKQLHAEFKSSFQGVENAFKVPIFGSDLKPQTVQMTNRDMQFLDQQEWLRDKITSIWGNNKAVIGVTDDVNRANAEESTLQWKRTTVRSEMKAICDTLNEFFVPRFGINLVLGFKDPVPEDETAKIEKSTKLKNSDLITLNEAREIISYDPIKGGDEFSFQRSERQAASLPAPLKYINLTKVLRRSGIYKKKEEYEYLQSLAKPIAKRIIQGRKQEEAPREHHEFSNEKVWDFHAKQLHIVEAQEEIFRNKCEQYINGLVQRAIENVPEEVALMKNKALLDEEDEVIRATLDFTPILNEVALISGQQALSFIGEEQPYLAMDIRKNIEANVKKFARSMIETDREKIIDILSKGVINGDSIPKIRKQITDTFAEFSKTQAERVTRTEVIRTSNLGSMDAWEQSGVVTGKQWLTALDDRVDPLCAYMNGKVISLQKNYFDKNQILEVNGHKADFSYGSIKVPPLHPNCRCTLLPVLLGENSFDAEQYLKIKGLEKDKSDLESKIDKRTKEYKDIAAKNLDLEGYVKELEAYLDET